MRRHALTIIKAHSLVIAEQFTNLLFLLVAARVIDVLHLVVVIIISGIGHAPVGGVSDVGSSSVETGCALVVNLQLPSVDSAHFRVSMCSNYKK